MNKRSKIVSFRLSNEEYDSLKSVSQTRGARSVSEFTRSVAFGKTGVDANLQEVLSSMTQQMQAIDQQLQAIAESLKSFPNPMNHIKEEPGE